MGIVAEPPPEIQVAQARELLFQFVAPLKVAQLTTISRNIKLDGTNAQQEAFKLTVSELYGIAARALSKTGKDRDAQMSYLATTLDQRILDNKDYDKFKTWVAATPDPLLPQ